MKHNKLCISKKTGYIIFFLTFFILLTYINKQFLQTKTGYQSKAAVPRAPRLQGENPTPTPTPGYLTSDPGKIMEYWRRYIIERSAIAKQNPAPFTLNPNIEEIKSYLRQDIDNLNYIGDLDYLRDYEQAKNGTLICMVGPLGDPFGLIFNEIVEGADSTTWNSMLNQSKITMSFFYSTDGKELSLVVASWLGPNATMPHAIRYIPNKSLVNAFSTLLFENKSPFTSNGDMRVTGCGDSKYKQWKKWAKYTLTDTAVKNIYIGQTMPPITPTPNPFQQRSAERYQNSPEVIAFMEELKAAYKISYPETVLYPLVDKNIKLKRVSSEFRTIYSKTKLWSYSEEQPHHLTYFFDKCPADQYGHFYQMLNVVLPALETGIMADNTGQLTPETWDENTVFVLTGKSFMNLPINRNAVQFLGGCIDAVSGVVAGPLCPNVKTNIEITSTNSVFVTFKTIKDNCEYIKPKDSPFIINRDFYRDYSIDDMTFLLYLGGPQGKSVVPRLRQTQ